MDGKRWVPQREYTKQEQWLMKRLVRTGKLFGFLREHRHELFDEAFQEELEAWGAVLVRHELEPAIAALLTHLGIPTEPPPIARARDPSFDAA